MSLLPSSLARSSPTSCSTLPTLRRQVRNIPRDPNPPKFRALLHPQGFVSSLPSGALFSYNPPPTLPTTLTTSAPIEPIVSATGKVLPSGWKRVPGYGHLAPRVDRRTDGFGGEEKHLVVPESVKEEIRALRFGDPEVWTCGVLGKKFSLPPFFITRIAPLPRELVQKIEDDRNLRLERLPLQMVVKEEARKISRSFW